MNHFQLLSFWGYRVLGLSQWTKGTEVIEMHSLVQELPTSTSLPQITGHLSLLLNQPRALLPPSSTPTFLTSIIGHFLLPIHHSRIPLPRSYHITALLSYRMAQDIFPFLTHTTYQSQTLWHEHVRHCSCLSPGLSTGSLPWADLFDLPSDKVQDTTRSMQTDWLHSRLPAQLRLTLASSFLNDGWGS